jgi:hypothetical protein
MKIIRNNNVKFKDLVDGDIFQKVNSDVLYMKIIKIQFYDFYEIEFDKEDAKDEINAVSLTNHHTSWCDDDEIVCKVNAHIVID